MNIIVQIPNAIYVLKCLNRSEQNIKTDQCNLRSQMGSGLTSSIPSKAVHVCRKISPAKIGSTDFVRMSKKDVFSW